MLTSVGSVGNAYSPGWGQWEMLTSVGTVGNAFSLGWFTQFMATVMCASLNITDSFLKY